MSKWWWIHLYSADYIADTTNKQRQKKQKTCQEF